MPGGISSLWHSKELLSSTPRQNVWSQRHGQWNRPLQWRFSCLLRISPARFRSSRRWLSGFYPRRLGLFVFLQDRTAKISFLFFFLFYLVEQVLLTGLLNISLIRSFGVFPFFVLSIRNIFFSSQKRSSFSTKTLPIKPEPPVMKTVLFTNSS